MLFHGGLLAAEVTPMTARSKPANRGKNEDRNPWEPSGLHIRASRHRDELIEEARSLMATGRIREARAAEKRAGQVDQLIGAVESDGTRGASTGRSQ